MHCINLILLNLGLLWSITERLHVTCSVTFTEGDLDIMIVGSNANAQSRSRIACASCFRAAYHILRDQQH